MAGSMPRWLRTLYGVPRHLYAHHAGFLLGHRFLQLDHVGRRSGRPYSTVLEVLHRDARAQEYFVVAGYGHWADWLRNVRAAQHVRIHIAREEHATTWRLVKEDEALAIFTAYERRYRVAAPALRLVLSRLLGWRYDGSPAARDRLVREMPMMAFRPVDEA